MLAAKLIGVPDPMLDAEIDVHFTEYAAKVADAGGIPVQLSRTADPVALVGRLDGVLLSGGADIDPRRYRSLPGPGQGGYEPARDGFEDAILGAAVKRGIPVLGICRGLQVINVHFGGTLIADLPPDVGEGHSSYAYPRNIRTHGVNINPDTVLSGLYGERAVVNSFHHQAVDRLGDGLISTATAPDGIVEALEHEVHDILGVQWHPEMLDDLEPCFSWLCKTADPTHSSTTEDP